MSDESNSNFECAEIKHFDLSFKCFLDCINKVIMSNDISLKEKVNTLSSKSKQVTCYLYFLVISFRFPDIY